MGESPEIFGGKSPSHGSLLAGLGVALGHWMTLAPVGHGGDGIRIWRQRRTRNPKGLEVARLIVAWQAPTNPPALLCMFAPARACGSRPGRRIFAISRQPQESSERPSRGGPGGGGECRTTDGLAAIMALSWRQSAASLNNSSGLARFIGLYRSMEFAFGVPEDTVINCGLS